MEDTHISSLHTPSDTPESVRNQEQHSLLISAIDEVYQRRHSQLCEKLGRIYAVSAMIYLLSGMVLVIAGVTIKDFFGIYVLLPLGIVFGIGSIFQYSASKNLFEHND